MKLEDAIKSSKFKSEVHKAGLNVMYTAWWLKTINHIEFKKFDLTQEQYNVLRILKGKHPNKMIIKDIATRLIEKNSNVPRIIDKLLLKELINRVNGEKDARQTEITLTEKGIESLEKATEALNQVWDNDLMLTDNEAATLSTLLEKMRTKEQ